MLVNFDVKDRMVILSILPSTGSIIELVDVLDMAKKLKLTDEEIKYIDFKQESDGRIFWDQSKELNEDFDLNLNQIKILKDIIAKLDSEKRITISMIDTCLKINKL